MITLRQLRYLSALARHQHFGRAAQACAVSQPALSMQIRELEQTLGVTLVERRPGQTVLTAIGREIAERGEAVLAASRDLMDFARHRGAPLSGRLILGVIPSLAPYLLPRLLPVLQVRFPQLDLVLRETQTRTLIDEVRSGGIDAAMLALPVMDPDIEVIELFDDRFRLAAPADDTSFSGAAVSVDGIDQRRLILLEDGHCLRDQALAFCATARGGVQTMARGASSLTTVMEMVAGGYGVTLVPDIAVEVERRNDRVKFIPLSEPVPGRRIGLIFRRTSPRKEDFAALGEAAIEVVKQ